MFTGGIKKRLPCMMPDADGREVFRRIRGIDPATRVIISSGYHEERDATDHLKEGAVRFVQDLPDRVAVRGGWGSP